MNAQIALEPSGPVIPQWTFADRLRKARQQTGFGQKEFAEHIGAKASAYAQWEAGNNQPRNIVSVAKSIELLTRIPAAWLLGIGDAPRAPEAPSLTV
ncbi:helix-turn-helix domain-containing protein [Microbacterium sp. Mu-80]|uniref:Helix-turn-helix domain-containing protein n=1 Tax=Microbacterium bandirmense TaxID=3122050 RepID=A0ABU8L7D5_9MICO